MTAENFQRAIPIILAAEGGYVNNPADSGGPTNLGITLRSLSDWLGREATIEQLQALTGDSVAPIYQTRYWEPAGCDACPAGVDLMMFDGAVNMGVGTMVRFLQATLGLQADGIAGPMTVGAVKKCDPARVIDQLATDRANKYEGLVNFDTFGAGWMARLGNIRTLAHQWAQEMT